MAPNLLGFRIAHRMMRGDSRRLAAVTGALARGGQRADAARLRAIGEFATKHCAGIHHHHQAEDDVLWPVIVRSAGAEVDLSDLTDDHKALDPLLEEITAAAAELPGSPSAVRRMAASLATLADLLDEHIEEEERLLFPVIEKYVPEEEWERVETEVRKGGQASFDLPRIGQYALPEELAALRRMAGPVLTVMLALMGPGHRRRQKLIFGDL
ncbi:hemerythrin domain-containing protein [Nonomuraea pusilla]|uniref:Hemerythrin HHE cation binding domain-containing protein n=1 Tax=Nonomuraea pusilla TaxID=46177 RepID=A0A1H7ZU36_9ACTN|nr:hemerythrin domain-containing protein [Nonomuraea pusilla]SEM61811.1 Hemerythrin HHE cation binding domain-containing protein [Nonomuraea pusilla]